MDPRTHIIRTNSFFEDPALSHNATRVYDNANNIIANKVAFEIDYEHRWQPIIVKEGDTPKAIQLCGRVYYLNIIAQFLMFWRRHNIVDDDQLDVIVRLVQYLVHEEELYWDLNFHFPGYYYPAASQTELQSVNIWGFITQFPSDPYVVTIDSDTVETDPLTEEPDTDDEMEPWEMLLDSLEL